MQIKPVKKHCSKIWTVLVYQLKHQLKTSFVSPVKHPKLAKIETDLFPNSTSLVRLTKGAAKQSVQSPSLLVPVDAAYLRAGRATTRMTVRMAQTRLTVVRQQENRLRCSPATLSHPHFFQKLKKNLCDFLSRSICRWILLRHSVWVRQPPLHLPTLGMWWRQWLRRQQRRGQQVQ